MTEHRFHVIYAQTFFTARRIDLGGKTLNQYLEQLRVAVRFQGRESASLVAYPARVMKPRR